MQSCNNPIGLVFIASTVEVVRLQTLAHLDKFLSSIILHSRKLTLSVMSYANSNVISTYQLTVSSAARNQMSR